MLDGQPASDSSVDMGAAQQPDTHCLHQTLGHLSAQTFNNMVLRTISGYLFKCLISKDPEQIPEVSNS